MHAAQPTGTGGSPISDITQILGQIGKAIRPQRMLAALRMAQEAPAQTLQATALVHEAYLGQRHDIPGVPSARRPDVSGVAVA